MDIDPIIGEFVVLLKTQHLGCKEPELEETLPDSMQAPAFRIEDNETGLRVTVSIEERGELKILAIHWPDPESLELKDAEAVIDAIGSLAFEHNNLAIEVRGVEERERGFWKSHHFILRPRSRSWIPKPHA